MFNFYCEIRNKTKEDNNLYAMTEAEFASVNYGSSECAIKMAERAMNHCTDDESFGRFEVETTRFLYNGYSDNKINLRVFINEVISRSTLFTDRSHGFKLLSELGGSLSLYIGFTLMSVLEMIAFFSVPRVRQYAQEDEDTLMQRKNPAIRNLPALFRALRLTIEQCWTRWAPTVKRAVRLPLTRRNRVHNEV